ncbi:hypothetical protein JCM3774_001367 [Rhodotorula dairenensis]
MGDAPASQATVKEIFPVRHAGPSLPSVAGDAASSSNRSSASSGRAAAAAFSLAAEPRSAKISSEPPIPADIHLMLMTTPPPPPQREQSAPQHKFAFSTAPPGPTLASSSGRPAFLSASTPRPSTPAREEDNVTGLASRMRALRFNLGGGGGERSSQPRSQQRPGSFADWTRKPDARGNSAATAASQSRAAPESPDREKRRRTTERKNGRMDSKTPADSVPKTWSDYAFAYALGQMDISDPPFPPVDAQQIGPSPYDLAHFPAPLDLSPVSAIRNRLIDHLDLLGRNQRYSDSYSSSGSHGGRSEMGRRSSHATGGTSSYSPSSWRSLVGDSTLRSLLSRALYAPMGTPALFKPAPKAAMITLFPPSSEPTATVTTIASLNLPHNLSIPLSHAIDAHVLLNGERGLVVPDTERDWRWRGNDLVCSRSFTVPGGPYVPASSDTGQSLGIRFYAAMPIFAPSMPELAAFEEEAGGRIAIGTIAVLDDWPRLTKFGSTERAKLRSLASEVTREIERFLLERGDAGCLSTEDVSMTFSPHPPHPPHPPPPSLPPPVPDVRESDEDPSVFVSARSSASGPPRAANENLLAQHCASLAKTLDLSLVYVVKLDLSRCPPPPATTGLVGLELLAAHNLPEESHASFDPALHLRALRAPEGGLLFRSPAESGGKFASGVLLPVAETPGNHASGSGAQGWVLAGYTVERERKWSSREMDAFETVRAALRPLLVQSPRVSMSTDGA